MIDRMALTQSGYVVLSMGEQAKEMVQAVRRVLERLAGPLETIHERYEGDILATQKELSDELIDCDLIPQIVRYELPFFKRLIGADLHIQKYPYLRIARPGRLEDNIGIHRDTWYGSSPYEMSCSIALTDTDEAGALRFVEGSHARPESAYTIEERASQHEKGSDGHKLGFLYAPKRIKDLTGDVGVPLRVGQAVVFGSAIAHGQEVNQSATTRVSVDVRLVNSLAPIKWDRSVHADYYRPFEVSPATEHARMYPGE